MHISATYWVFGVLLASVLSMTGRPAVARDMQVCGAIANLERIQQQHAATATLADPVGLRTQLVQLSARLKQIRRTNSDGSKGHLTETLSSVIGTLDHVTGRENTNAETVSAYITRSLPVISRALQRVEPMFGCDEDKRLASDELSESPRSTDRSLNSSPATIISVSPVTLGASALVAILVVIISVMALRWCLADRATRLVCRTPLLLVHGENCSVTSILDINRSGMKVEVAPEHVEKIWVDLFFCGHKASGQVMWKNSFFAGIQFKRKISQQMLEDVIEKSRTSLADSGLKLNATPCFSVGCHINCPRHQPTAISTQKKDT